MKWMQTRASELAGNETWQASCVASYGRVPGPKEMSIKELEETLTAVGDQEVKAMRDINHGIEATFGVRCWTCS